MRVMVLIKANADSEKGVMPQPEYIAEMMKFNEMLVNKGIMLSGDGLHPTSKSKRVRFERGKKPVIIDGPFAETKEAIAGFWIWKVKDLDEAAALVKQIPEPDYTVSPASSSSEIEIRQIFEMDDFENVTPETRRKADELDAKLKARA
jgi:hypothetical protein